MHLDPFINPGPVLRGKPDIISENIRLVIGDGLLSFDPP